MWGLLDPASFGFRPAMDEDVWDRRRGTVQAGMDFSCLALICVFDEDLFLLRQYTFYLLRPMVLVFV